MVHTVIQLCSSEHQLGKLIMIQMLKDVRIPKRGTIVHLSWYSLMSSLMSI